MKWIEDGNFTPRVRAAFVIGGVTLWIGSLAWVIPPRWLRLIAFFIGFAIMLIGGITSRSHSLGVKPFGNSYHKARKSYKEKGDTETDRIN
ncbi:unnamed protein product [Mycetohabitans rhizoxinica HKI 454]|uniref:Uncharacterized protein n=1 Tax=Mycetohabitans rhizoxinica (strain DSM 19002 / CIP 109453 / HKI 454) TaxID=882378 RepID=E5AMV2_MYCRK|nr:unnamed protein product [Mycetohabitans rhizoxinica HKI 454]